MLGTISSFLHSKFMHLPQLFAVFAALFLAELTKLYLTVLFPELLAVLVTDFTETQLSSPIQILHCRKSSFFLAYLYQLIRQYGNLHAFSFLLQSIRHRAVLYCIKNISNTGRLSRCSSSVFLLSFLWEMVPWHVFVNCGFSWCGVSAIESTTILLRKSWFCFL